MEQLIHQNGYLTIFLAIAFSGELGVFVGVALARTGAVSLTGVVILGTAESFVANMFYYYLGKLLWKRWAFLRRRFGESVTKTSPAVLRYGSTLMLLSRFFYGIRDIIPTALGLYQVRAGGFAIFNMIGAFIWAFSFTILGSAFSDLFLNRYRIFQVGLMLGLAVAAVIVMAYVLIRNKISKMRG